MLVVSCICILSNICLFVTFNSLVTYVCVSYSYVFLLSDLSPAMALFPLYFLAHDPSQALALVHALAFSHAPDSARALAQALALAHALARDLDLDYVPVPVLAFARAVAHSLALAHAPVQALAPVFYAPFLDSVRDYHCPFVTRSN